MAVDALLIAPCGLNCGLCRAYLRPKNKCPGCRASDATKPITRTRCKIKTCETFKQGTVVFCGDCAHFPCQNLLNLDQRYRLKYHLSLIENLKNIKELGLVKFLADEKIKWTCAHCGGTICIHNSTCNQCGHHRA